jgi:drug/metabolite transporter (DMT)-like permease
MKRAVRTLIQIIGVAAVIFGVLEIVLEIAHHQIQVHDHVNPVKNNIWNYVIGAVLMFVGVILFLGSNSLAEQLTDDYDDEDGNDSGTTPES